MRPESPARRSGKADWIFAQILWNQIGMAGLGNRAGGKREIDLGRTAALAKCDPVLGLPDNLLFAHEEIGEPDPVVHRGVRDKRGNGWSIARWNLGPSIDVIRRNEI